MSVGQLKNHWNLHGRESENSVGAQPFVSVSVSLQTPLRGAAFAEKFHKAMVLSYRNHVLIPKVHGP